MTTICKNKDLTQVKIKDNIIKYFLSKVSLDYQVQPLTNEQDLKTIKDNEYSITPKYRGQKSWIIFIRIGECNYYAVSFPKNKLNSKDLQLYPINLMIEKRIYDGTIMEGVYIKNSVGNKILIIDEIYYLEGKDMLKEKRDIRLDITSKYFQENIERSLDYQIYVCTHFTSNENHLKNLYDLTKTDQQIEGWMFYPNYYHKQLPIFYYEIKLTDLSEEVTQFAIFNMKKTQITDIYELYNNEQKIGHAFVPNAEATKKFKSWFKDVSNIKVKCRFNNDNHKWTPIEQIL
jgi:hypothetical protein